MIKRYIWLKQLKSVGGLTKMKFPKRVFSLILVAVIFLFLAACEGEEKEGLGNNGEETNNENNVNNEETTEETYDLGGRKITIASHFDMSPEEGTEMGDLQYERWKEVEEKYNISIEWIEIPYDQKVEQLTTTSLAGEPFADLVQLGTLEAAGLAQDDFIYALDDLIDLSETKMTEGVQDIGRVNPDGKVYLLGTLGSLAEGGGIYYNKTMFEQAGLEDPYELQQKGEWTWETFLNAARALTTGDQYGLSAEPFRLGSWLILSNDAQFLDTETGEIKLDDPHTMEALEFMADLYNVHDVIRPNDRSSDWEDPPIFFNEGLVGMTTGMTWESSEERQEAPFDWGYVYFPMGPNATDYGALRDSGGGMVIPKGLEDPELVYKIWEDMQIWEYEREDQVNWFESIFPNQESVDTATQMLDNVKVHLWSVYNLADAFYGCYDSISTGEESHAQTTAQIKPEAQGRVDEFIGGE